MKNFRQAISILLVLSLISALALPVCAQEDKSLLFTVATDLHLKSVERIGSMKNNAAYSETDPYYDKTTQGQMENISEALLDAMLEAFAQSEDEYLLLCGDLTNGSITDHNVLSEKLAAVENSTGKQIFVINGNHDIASGRTDKICSSEEFKSCYSRFGYDEALCVDENSCSYTAKLSDKYRLIAIDSCVYGEDEGEISAEKLAWICAQAKQAEKDGVTLVAMMHHSILLHFPLQDMMSNYGYFASKFADTGIKYVFSGHMHGNDIAQSVSLSGNKIYDIMTGSLITSPCAYRHVRFSENGVDISTDYVKSVSTCSLPADMTALQLSLISSDFPSYAYGYFESGMEFWLNRHIGSAYKIAKTLGIESGTKAYDALECVMSVVGKAINLPLYNTENTPEKYDSIEEIAALYGYTLPESGYEYAYQLVSAIMAAFFAGDENMTSDSLEIKLMLSVVSVGVSYAVASVFSGTDSNKLTSLYAAAAFRCGILSRVTLGSCKANRCADVIIAAILLPLVEGISDDAYSPSDLFVTLEAPDVASTEKRPDMAELTAVEKIFKYIVEYFRTLFSFIFI